MTARRGPVLIVFSVIFFVVGIVLLVLRIFVAKRIRTVQGVALAPALDAARAAPGSLVAVEGTVHCAEPLVGEFSERRCVYFSANVVDEVQAPDTDSEGRATTKTERTTVYSTTHSVPFAIIDPTGSLRIVPDDAKVDAAESFQRRERQRGATRIFTEHALFTDAPAYVLGTVRADGAVGAADKAPFFIDHRSARDKLAADRRTARWLTIGGAAAAVVGLILLGAASFG